MTSSLYLIEASPRIQHIEDLIFFNGSKGAKTALTTLSRMMKGGHNKKTTVKWDGSPAIIFGRDESGQFILTDKSGWAAKGYDGKTKSGDDLMNMMLDRSGGNPDAGRKAFAIKMRNLFDVVETSVPKDFRGFFKGDLLYYTTPPIEDDRFVFTPNIVTYTVAVHSELGERIARSEAGVVVHNQMDMYGEPTPMTDLGTLESGQFMIFPPITTQKPADIPPRVLQGLNARINKYSAGIDKMLDPNTLAELRMTNLPNILYTYTNQQVDSGNLENIGENFSYWLQHSNVSAAKQIRLEEYLDKHRVAFRGVWEIVRSVMNLKNRIISQFDSQELDITQHINGNQGGEGYVYSDPRAGDIKLVPRSTFSAANRAVER